MKYGTGRCHTTSVSSIEGAKKNDIGWRPKSGYETIHNYKYG